LTTLAAAAAAGFLLWFAPHFDRWSTGGYWEVMGLMAGAGLLIGLSQLHVRDGNPLASFLLAFLPVLVAAGWVILATEPHGNWIRDHVSSWSGHLGIDHGVHNLGEHVAVLAFGLGLVLGLTFEPRMVRRRQSTAAAAESPSTEVEREPVVPPADEPDPESTQTGEPVS
jgi:hypothetical protein